MKKIPEGYKETEFGVIPQEWEIKLLSECSLKIGDGLHGTPVYCESGKYYFINGNNLKNGKILIDMQTKKIGEEEYEKYRVDLDLRTLLISLNGTIGNLAYYNNEKIILGKSAGYIRLKEGSNKTYIYQLLQTKSIQNFIQKELTGSTIKNLSLRTLRNIPITFPPLPEQQKIAEILSSVDDHIEKLDETISEYELLKKGMMKKLLTEGIGHTEFKDTELGRIPKDWEVRKLGEVCDVVSGGTPKTDRIEYWENGDILWATPTDITNNGKYINSTGKTITKLGLQNSSARLVPKGSILMTSRATIGERSINTLEMSTNQGFKALICKDNTYNEYIYYYIDILLPEILKNSSGSTFKEISKAKTEVLLLAIPSFIEQQQIASILSSIDERIDLYKSEKEDFMQVKKGLMEKLLTGKIRI